MSNVQECHTKMFAQSGADCKRCKRKGKKSRATFVIHGEALCAVCWQATPEFQAALGRLRDRVHPMAGILLKE